MACVWAQRDATAERRGRDGTRSRGTRLTAQAHATRSVRLQGVPFRATRFCDDYFAFDNVECFGLRFTAPEPSPYATIKRKRSDLPRRGRAPRAAQGSSTRGARRHRRGGFSANCPGGTRAGHKLPSPKSRNGQRFRPHRSSHLMQHVVYGIRVACGALYAPACPPRRAASSSCRLSVAACGPCSATRCRLPPERVGRGRGGPSRPRPRSPHPRVRRGRGVCTCREGVRRCEKV